MAAGVTDHVWEIVEIVDLLVDLLVLEETKRFHQALPSLLPDHRGKWIVFKEGSVHSEHDSEDAAYAAAVNAYGKNGGFVVAQVAEVSPLPITAGVLFGIA
jgi:hypothetical protein